MKKSIVILIILSVSCYAMASTNVTKNPNSFGFKAGINYTILNGPVVTPTLGFSYEWVPKWSGIETGVYYTNYLFDYNGLYSHTHHLQIPLLWKIHTKHVNIALGAQTLWYLGYNINEEKSSSTDSKAVFAKYDGFKNAIGLPMVFDIGVALKIGFPIKLNDNWVMEPQIGAEYMYGYSFAINVGVVFRINRK